MPTSKVSSCSMGEATMRGPQFDQKRARLRKPRAPVAAPRQAPPSLVVLGVLRPATARHAQSPLRHPLAAGRPVVRCFEDGAHPIGYCTIYAAVLETACFRLSPD